MTSPVHEYKVVPDDQPNHDGWMETSEEKLQCGDEIRPGFHIVQHGRTFHPPVEEDYDAGLSMHMQMQQILHRR